MVLVYRGILLAQDDPPTPLTGDNNGDQLGVRVTGPTPDVATTVYNDAPWVEPTNEGKPQGTSVSPGTGCNLPAHRRPKGPPWNGTSDKKRLRVWQLDTDQLVPDQLQYVPDPRDLKHGFLSPGVPMSLEQYRKYVHDTAPLWKIVPAPSEPCAGEEVGGEPVDVEERAALVDATASGGDVEDLVAELRSANAAGTGRAALIAELTAGVERAEDDDAAEVLREVLDRVTGFCAPHVRIDLTD